MSSLKESLQTDMKAALRAGEKDRLGVIRLALAAIQRREVDDRVDLDDAGILQVIEKLVKQGTESARLFEAGGRADLVKKELAEVELLKNYLPDPLTEDALDALISEIIQATGAASVRDMGKVMNAIREQAQGRVDMGVVSSRVKAKLIG